MRARIFEAKATERADPWSLKHAAGGLMEIEFLTQTGALLTGQLTGLRTSEVLGALGATGWLDQRETTDLSEALVFQQRLQQIERVALEAKLSPDAGCPELRHAVARAVDMDDFEAVAARLPELQARAAEICACPFAGR